ncbi:MAG: YegS/Rv2252/BmrU family lipid kinase [Prevotellaceae bacterium]|nr:YegS/Rv2252/BmrU family lipid kinase [Prevotellaceae bacterium]
MKQRVLFIVNPVSGTGSKQKILAAVEQYLNTNLFIPEIRETQRAGHAEEIAREAAADAVDVVVAIGGDGTVNEVGRGLIGTSTALGIIPCGSGNGLARHLHIPLIPRQAVELLNSRVIHTLDYGRIDGNPFFCTCGVGFDAILSKGFAEAGRRGLITYLEQALKQWLSFRPQSYIIEDALGRHHYEAFLIACANASQYGNNAYIAPEASMSDGLMDVVVIEPFNMWEAAEMALQLFSRTILFNSHVKVFKSDHIRIRRSGGGVIHCDGDPLIAGETVDVQLIEKGLRVVVCPPEMKKQPYVEHAFESSMRQFYGFQQQFQHGREQLGRLSKESLGLLKKK